MDAFFEYGKAETEYLSSRDKRLGAVIAALGHIDRPVESDLFTSVVNSIVGQQISVKAHATIWKRMVGALGAIDAKSVAIASPEALQACGMSFRKAAYIQDFAQQVRSGRFDVNALPALSDEEVVAGLSALKGVGRWTAEMIMLHCMQRPDVLSFDDLGIQRGLRMIYHHRHIDRTLFERYRRRFSPCGSVASIYIWAVSAGGIPGMKDYAPAVRQAGR